MNFEGFRIVKIDFNFKVGCRWKRLEIFDEIFISILFYFILFLFLFYFYFYLFIEIR